MKILIINCGSSSIKYKLFKVKKKHKEEVLDSGLVEHIGEKDSLIKDHYTGLKTILERIEEKVDAVGHRVVHGGEEFKEPVIINRRIIMAIKKYCRFAPLHNPANLAGILAIKKLLPRVKQVAVFDTAFHQSIPEYAYIYGLPYHYYKKYGIRRYGFHGTSHNYVTEEASRRLKRPLDKLRLITCHLGNGCSICAVKYGKSIDTSMGFTPLEGLIMGTRCGDIDPALVTYIMQQESLGTEEIEEILNKESGLKGISGISNDMRLLLNQTEKGNLRAKLAIEVFVYRIKKYISAYIGILGGVDAVVFTAGIGQNQPEIVNMVCADLFSYLKKKPKILVIPTNEELMICRQTYALLKGRGNV
ncbi:MAG: acetate kinase [Candidatus Omnitrophica bacterium]|nr:acetate kinase [Candidatus Omnitrophota bacterium]